MTRRQHLLAAGRSFARLLGACAATAYTAIGKANPLDFTAADLKAFAGALLAALLATGVNWLRAGDTRFGRGVDEAPPPVPPGTSVPAGGHVEVLETPPGEPAAPADVDELDDLPTAPAEGD